MDGGNNSNNNSQQDSPLSITSNIVGLLTFLVAIAAAAYARVAYLRNSDDEYFRVKASLSWYKTESRWLSDLLTALYVEHNHLLRRQHQHEKHDQGAVPPRSTEFEMYSFVMDDLLNLEQRLLDLVTEVEEKVSRGDQGSFTLVRGGRRAGRPSVAMAWLPVRTKALELVRQREALTARVQFLQMSLMSSRLRDLEARTKWAEAKFDAGLIEGNAQRGGWA
ncbi:N-acetylglucosaminylphosphatidylinositol deacetylase [Purpureocillium takamizusanense]|uniref:N-acetylglucosaminylphosphatidylinositol deacetylase n=1 Tax=Purpureocillium takamizusanense TaxID=2060973 RepID=A0A9Q8QBW3_9HYPO|nr:N-acetylglucosaminylphosphatidylinositol deacetylase [Purpureocillium takamizusanense]UNI17213.1 N-acetylglucosaminylphosphatidylinositol deacetylase [Purpureocillium takamizusanense]